ncbi:Cytokinesis protein sepH [Zancudomyces culisetae]|uniref:Cytokinesis protein sepH n=1 Tax=Zancudomyces culisetae TaxID=1213189 RepID=A0A1R1PIQ3_ZANCU|nr:Cytokinesis protein sepH [Zancudomyces culisetae]|eukprot:OMH80836.1 Cytokinesis protein sepH [Zancudomyces culisetae]
MGIKETFLFDTVDLYENKNINKVILTLLHLEKIHNKNAERVEKRKGLTDEKELEYRRRDAEDSRRFRELQRALGRRITGDIFSKRQWEVNSSTAVESEEGESRSVEEGFIGDTIPARLQESIEYSIQSGTDIKRQMQEQEFNSSIETVLDCNRKLERYTENILGKDEGELEGNSKESRVQMNKTVRDLRGDTVIGADNVMGLRANIPESEDSRRQHSHSTVVEAFTATKVAACTRGSSIYDSLKKRLVVRNKSMQEMLGEVYEQNYQLGNCIGKGQYGAVFRALNFDSGKMVAIKKIPIAMKGMKGEEIMREVDILKSLSSPRIVKYYDFVRTDEYLFLVMEYVENGSLAATLKSFGVFPEKLVLAYVIKTIEGLIYLHSRNVVHCDLKAANILTTKQGNTKLADFGVSIKLGLYSEDGEDAGVMGSPFWMAPEIIKLEGATEASDIWSLGCTIIELLTGSPPYFDLVPLAALYRIVVDEHPPIPENISPELKDFLLKCFQKDPKARPTSMMLMEHPWITQVSQQKKQMQLLRRTFSMRMSRVLAESEINRKKKVIGIAPMLDLVLIKAKKETGRRSSSFNRQVKNATLRSRRSSGIESRKSSVKSVEIFQEETTNVDSVVVFEEEEQGMEKSGLDSIAEEAHGKSGVETEKTTTTILTPADLYDDGYVSSDVLVGEKVSEDQSAESTNMSKPIQGNSKRTMNLNGRKVILHKLRTLVSTGNTDQPCCVCNELLVGLYYSCKACKQAAHQLCKDKMQTCKSSEGRLVVVPPRRRSSKRYQISVRGKIKLAGGRQTHRRGVSCYSNSPSLSSRSSVAGSFLTRRPGVEKPTNYKGSGTSSLVDSAHAADATTLEFVTDGEINGAPFPVLTPAKADGSGRRIVGESKVDSTGLSKPILSTKSSFGSIESTSGRLENKLGKYLVRASKPSPESLENTLVAKRITTQYESDSSASTSGGVCISVKNNAANIRGNPSQSTLSATTTTATTTTTTTTANSNIVSAGGISSSSFVVLNRSNPLPLGAMAGDGVVPKNRTSSRTVSEMDVASRLLRENVLHSDYVFDSSVDYRLVLSEKEVFDLESEIYGFKKEKEANHTRVATPFKYIKSKLGFNEGTANRGVEPNKISGGSRVHRNTYTYGSGNGGSGATKDVNIESAKFSKRSSSFLSLKSGFLNTLVGIGPKKNK